MTCSCVAPGGRFLLIAPSKIVFTALPRIFGPTTVNVTLTIARRITPTISGASGRSVAMSRRNEPRKSFGLAAGRPMPMPIIAAGAGRRQARPSAPAPAPAPDAPRRGAARARSAAHAAASFSDICEYTISR